MDEVKNMNRMVRYSKCVSIRDDQLLQKKVCDDSVKFRESKLDIVIEVNRLKEI